MTVLGNAKMLSVGVKKAFDCSRIHSVTRVYEDLEFLVSRCSMESHTFFASCESLSRRLRMS